MDELFEHDRVGEGMPVTIVGSELTRDDILSIQDYMPESELRSIQRKLARLGYYHKEVDGEMGTGTRLALGRFQRANALVPTCQFDAATKELLDRTE